MTSVSQLGRLCLSHSRAQLQLTSDAVVTTSLTQTITGENPNATLLAPLDLASVWVRRGGGFHLELDVSVNGRSPDSDLQQYLAKSICNANFWEQLNFQAVWTPETAPNEDNTAIAEGKIVVQLTCSNQDVPPNSRHRLPTGASMSDVQPPHGVEVAHLESARLTLYLLSCKSKKKGAKQKTKRMHTQGLSAASVQTHESGSLAEDDYQMAMPLDDSQGMVADATLPAAGKLRHLNPSTGLPQRIDSGTAFTDDRSSKGGAGKHEPEQPSSEHILELIDSALRLTICEKPLKLPPGIKITRDNVTRLATVAPALWRPNHLKAVSERAPFLPTIAHALSRSLPAKARSASLKRKAAELLGHHPPAASRTGPLSPEDVQHDKGPNFAYEAASIGLWNILQRGEFDSGANGRLKRLKTQPSNVDAHGIGEHDEMLYGSSGEWQQSSDPFANEEDPANLHSSSQTQLPGDEMLWECSEYEETDMRSPLRAPATPCENGKLLRIFRSGNTDEDLLLDWGDSTESGYGVVSRNLLEAQGSPARPKAQVPAAYDDDMGANASFEATCPTETLIPADAYDRLSTDPEMLFSGEFRGDEDSG